MTRDLRTLIYLLNLEGCKRMRGAAVKADAIGEQQPKRTRSGAAVEADASGEHAAAAEAGAIGEQQLELRGRKREAADEADAIGPGIGSSRSGRNRGARGRYRRAAALHRELSGAGSR